MKIRCPHCHKERKSKHEFRTIRRLGSYYRKSDGQHISRFWCLHCKRYFSSASLHPNFRQKKRHLNEKIRRLLSAGVSQREAARVLKVNRKTIVRKFRILAERAKFDLNQWNQTFPKAIEVEFDDLETFEHTKCKPVSVTLMVEYKSRRILGFEVAQMPAKGPLARIALKKYGPRADHRGFARERLFTRMQEFVHPEALIRSDSNPHYTSDVKKFFPEAVHTQIMGGRGAVTGQGELKKLKHDPIFSLNHTCAMLRYHMSRLIRKTWNTTKKIDQLGGHIALYALMHNQRLDAG